jgi:hypothetical protein
VNAAVRQAASFVRHVAATIERAARVVYVVPAINQRDWHPHPTWASPLLSAAEARRRRALLAEGERRLADGDPVAAADRAAAVIALEENTSPYGHHLLGRSALQQGDAARAAACFDAAATNTIALPVSAPPVCYSAIARALADTAASVCHGVIDLPSIFEAAGSVPTGRELFLDHVHLTATGTVLAVSELARACVPLLAPGVAVPHSEAVRQIWWSVQTDVCDYPSALVQSHFLAAVFNSRYGQPDDLVSHHLRVAAGSAPTGPELIAAYARRSLCTPTDALDTKDVLPLIVALPKLTPHLLRHPETPQSQDITFCRLALDVVSWVAPSHPAAGLDAVMSRYSELKSGTDLLPLVIGRNVRARVGYRPDIAPYSAGEHDTHVWLPFDGRQACKIRIELKATAGPQESGAMSLQLDGSTLYEWRPPSHWHVVRLVVPRVALQTGSLHTLTIRWPEPAYCSAEGRRQAVSALQAYYYDGPARMDEGAYYYTTTLDHLAYWEYGKIASAVAEWADGPEPQNALVWVEAEAGTANESSARHLTPGISSRRAFVGS